MKIQLSLLSLLFVCLISATSVAEDWPKWMGLSDGVWNETGIVDKFPEGGPEVLWRQPIGPGYTGPSVVGDHVYVMDRTKDEGKGVKVENGIRQAGQIAGGERVMCLDIASGKTVWEHTYDCPYTIAYPTGPRCTPTVDGDFVFTLGAMGHLKCFNRSSGEIVWEKNLMEEYGTKPPPWGFSSHPIVDGDHLLLPVGGGQGSAVVCFNKSTGEEVWRNLISTDVAYAPLMIFEGPGPPAKRQLLFWHGDGVDSLNPNTGRLYWHVTWPEEKAQPAATTIVTPRFVENQMFISEFYRGALLLEIESDPPSVKELYRTFKTDPRHKTSLNSLMTTPVVKDGLIYGVTGTGEMRCNDWKTGELKWSKTDWMGEEGSDPVVFATAFIVENEDRYLMFTDIGELIIAKFSAEGFEELDRAKVLEPTGVARGRKVVWSHPAFSDGKMFARNDEEIICVNLKK